jgi:hypothetical protein
MMVTRSQKCRHYNKNNQIYWCVWRQLITGLFTLSAEWRLLGRAVTPLHSVRGELTVRFTSSVACLICLCDSLVRNSWSFHTKLRTYWKKQLPVPFSPLDFYSWGRGRPGWISEGPLGLSSLNVFVIFLISTKKKPDSIWFRPRTLTSRYFKIYPAVKIMYLV